MSISRSTRGKLIQKRCEETGTPKKTLYKLLRQYWQRGCVPNALLPDYRNAGGKGKKKVSTQKLGRPRSITPGQGSIIDASVERMFRIVLGSSLRKRQRHLFALRTSPLLRYVSASKPETR